MISRKAIASHVNECHHLYSLDIDAFITTNPDGSQSVQLKGKGIDKTFTSTKSAKAWLTKLNNKLICEAVDRRLAYV